MRVSQDKVVQESTNEKKSICNKMSPMTVSSKSFYNKHIKIVNCLKECSFQKNVYLLPRIQNACTYVIVLFGHYSKALYSFVTV